MEKFVSSSEKVLKFLSWNRKYSYKGLHGYTKVSYQDIADGTGLPTEVCYNEVIGLIIGNKVLPVKDSKGVGGKNLYWVYSTDQKTKNLVMKYLVENFQVKDGLIRILSGIGNFIFSGAPVAPQIVRRALSDLIADGRLKNVTPEWIPGNCLFQITRSSDAPKKGKTFKVPAKWVR